MSYIGNYLHNGAALLQAFSVCSPCGGSGGLGWVLRKYLRTEMGGKHEKENLIFKNQTFILHLKAGVLLLLE